MPPERRTILLISNGIWGKLINTHKEMSVGDVMLNSRYLEEDIGSTSEVEPILANMTSEPSAEDWRLLVAVWGCGWWSFAPPRKRSCEQGETPADGGRLTR
jgi:hypothetical protein